MDKDSKNGVTALVRCPNYCEDGKLRQEYSNVYAGWIGYRKCEFCKGKGVVTVKEAERIEKIL